MTASTSLEMTLERLDQIIGQARTDRSYLGVFPAMYRSVTAAVHEAVRQGGFFDDDERIEHLTVVFADLYFEAYEEHQSGEAAADCWEVAFEAAEGEKRRMILQHLLLGMNAHINLDLGLATVVAAGEDLSAVQGDFNRVNELLFQVLDNLQDGLGEVSPRMALIDKIGGSWDESIMRVGIRSCRDLAWRFANRMAVGPDKPLVVLQREADTTWLARSMLRPWNPINMAAKIIVRVESEDIPTIVECLDHRTVDFDKANTDAIEDLPALTKALDSGTPSLYQRAHRRANVRRHVKV